MSIYAIIRSKMDDIDEKELLNEQAMLPKMWEIYIVAAGFSCGVQGIFTKTPNGK